MAMRQQHPGPQFDLPIPPARPEHFATSASRLGVIDASVCEWTADLSVRSHLERNPAHASVSGIGFVDFDAEDSIHETTESVGSIQP